MTNIYISPISLPSISTLLLLLFIIIKQKSDFVKKMPVRELKLVRNLFLPSQSRHPPDGNRFAFQIYIRNISTKSHPDVFLFSKLNLNMQSRRNAYVITV